MRSRFLAPVLSHIQVQCYPPLKHLFSSFGDFSNGIYHVMRITTVENNPDTELLFHQTFFFRSNIQMPITMAVAFDQGHISCAKQ